MINIFLTGCTGFLGGKLIKNLVELNHNLYVLVRNTEKGEKIKHTFSAKQQQRINLIKGDITLPYCGLSKEDRENLKNKIDMVYHLAALVKFDLELRDELFSINYDGTKNTLELANSINSKKFYYVSTAYTVGKNEEGKEELYPANDEYNNPYEESKVKSEHLVFSYKDKMNVAIFRPSIIVGDSKTGEADSTFTLYGFIRGLEVFKKRVSRKKEWETKTFRIMGSENGTSNFVPVDYVSDILTAAVENAESNKIYHIVNTNPPSNLTILTYIKKYLDFHNLDIIHKNGSHTLTPEEIALNKVVDAFSAYLDRAIVFIDNNTKNLLNKSNIPYLNMDEEMLTRIIATSVGKK